MTALFSKAAAPFIVFATLVAAAALLAYLAIATVNGMVKDARAQAIVERDNFWTGSIEKSNAAVAKQETAQAQAALRIEVATSASVLEQQNQLALRKIQNAALPSLTGSCFDSDHIQLLPD